MPETIILCVLATLAVVVAAIGIVLLCRRKKSVPATETEADLIISQGISRAPQEYDGLYESLYQAALDEKQLIADAYQEWCDRVSQSNDTEFREAFQSIFKKNDIHDETVCREQFRRLLAQVERAGILRDRDNNLVCVADEAVKACYIDITGQKMETNVSYQIIKPAWTMDGKVIEYGMAMRNK